MALQLRRGEGRAVGPTEELQQRRIAQLVETGLGIGPPLPQCLPALVREPVDPTPTTGLLATFTEQARLRKPGALRVELGVGMVQKWKTLTWATCLSWYGVAGSHNSSSPSTA